MAPTRRNERRHPVTIATAAGVLSLVLPFTSLVRLYRSTGSWFPFAYTFLVSLVTFCLYGYDKMQARNLQWRVKEVTLHTWAILGGWPGALLGRHFFQHKTRKAAFQVPFWIIVMGWQVFWWIVWRVDLSASKARRDWSAYM
ncbi:DUF1294-domain-containing protein [Bimuria novae-zelandiae CBS 107.79]|uniref:DUF1294-domain-containing protein n=1 Tax=Bimuria novae-zelandiae CBS 107.79 TaxID=1447943 RepID=A0A6A5VHC9_9PLEO|nr:DUF1294-domain-containing protein [Bimuria novae-zelandiae CBS 107.79]